jgi:hypothetical protein
MKSVWTRSRGTLFSRSRSIAVSMNDLSGLSKTRLEFYQRQGLVEDSQKDIKLSEDYNV